MQKVLLSVSVVLLLVIVGYSFMIVGSPSYQRQLREDSIKIEDMKNIRCTIENYYYSNGVLPADMQAIRSFHNERMNGRVNGHYNSGKCHCFMPSEINHTDPQGQEYAYRVTGNPANGKYTLCGDFNVAAEELKKNRYVNDAWAKDYKQGHHCFEVTISKCTK
ncbi:MAG: hypothetical protein AB7L92_01500 [Alphaproteobacteria bacterium]